MGEPRFRNRDGSLTMYAFACGYVESFTVSGKGYYATDEPGVTLYMEGVLWHVKAHTLPHGNERVWNCFDTLTEARKAFRRYRRAIIAGLDVVPLDTDTWDNRHVWAS